jgi:hypothetical protein
MTSQTLSSKFPSLSPKGTDIFIIYWSKKGQESGVGYTSRCLDCILANRYTIIINQPLFESFMKKGMPSIYNCKNKRLVVGETIHKGSEN